ncbi:MAG TPA: hypothetical protein VKR06_43660 [Ktedonosporobacter sp.]|nr:hypothetical protein [Ktedonosporobacter sp.]
MKNKQQGFSEYSEPFPHYVKQELSTLDEKRDQLLLEQLLDRGFVWEEAIQLINLREHLYDNIEVRQRMADDCHIQFARWLYENGELNDNE